MKKLLTLALVVALMGSVGATPKRHRSVIAAFIKAHGYPIGYTPGSHVVDHRWPLCDGGKDGEPNLQWQDTPTSYRKDADERALCSQAAGFAKKWDVSR